jgi:hypothetical protein
MAAFGITDLFDQSKFACRSTFEDLAAVLRLVSAESAQRLRRYGRVACEETCKIACHHEVMEPIHIFDCVPIQYRLITRKYVYYASLIKV